ncbi:MAG: ATP-binding protein [Bacteroidota bacterium]
MKNFMSENSDNKPFKIPDLKLEPSNSPLNSFLINFKPNVEEFIILLLALVPHIRPNLLDSIVQKHIPAGGDFPEIGGVKGENYRGMLPTGESAQFILFGNDVANRLRITHYFSENHFFRKKNILHIDQVKSGEPVMSGKIILSQEYVEILTLGIVLPPAFSSEFPARRIESQMNWNDLVLHQTTLEQVNDIRTWLMYNKKLEEDPIISRKIKKGYRVLFYGPPGTGKTLTASLLGNQFNKDVYRIDLSQVVSKYIGETEKNMEKVFSKAENKDWILFFDEADALFGKRSNVSSAHDKYANQEVSYLLQRVEDYPGLIILASNFKNNIDQAFIRRFNAIIHFPMPNADERFSIWQKNIPASIPLNNGVLLKSYAQKYELSGSGITNIMQYAALHALSNGQVITRKDIEKGINRELQKEDKMFH